MKTSEMGLRKLIQRRFDAFRASLLAPINRRFGTYRGLARLALAHGEVYLGTVGAFMRPDFGAVRRVVFVCQGNICRSCFAEQSARTRDLATASFGFATGGNAPADPDAIATAQRFGTSLAAHRTTDLEDFEFQDGDLLLVMEIRQARVLAKLVAGRNLQVSLLGLWATPQRPHIHDPHGLSLDYFETCFGSIASAVAGVAAQLFAAGAPAMTMARVAEPQAINAGSSYSP
jgi:protein-tyrosine phosphatase